MSNDTLFEQARIGDRVANNRIAMPAIHLGLATDGRPGAAVIDFYERRARGGAGAIAVGVCDTYGHPSTRIAGTLGLWDDGQVPAMAELAGAIKEHGALAGVQIVPLKGYNDPTWMPDPQELADMLASVGQAAARAVRAGFDFVELMLSGGSVLSHLLSPALSEIKVPGYSDGLNERLRAPLEAIAAIVAAIGGQLPIGVRLHGHEFLDGGYGTEQAREVVPALEAAGVTAFNVTGGGHRTTLPQITHQTPPLAFVHLARAVRRQTERTVLFGGRLRTPGEAEACLVCSGADFVNLGRALIADADWPRKVADGREREILPCMACGACFDQAVSHRPIACSLDPEVGLAPTELPPMTDPSEGKRVLIVGAGPAGLQAAWSLAGQGHRVELWERSKVAGGRWRLASNLHGREDLGQALRAFIARFERRGVRIATGIEATPQSVREFAPDALILAVGALPRRPEIPGLDEHKNVLLAEEVPDRIDRVGRAVAIIGAGGVGVELAVHLAGRGEPSLEALGFLARYGERSWLDEALAARSGIAVTILRRRGYAGRGLGRSVRWTMLRDVERLGVRVIDRCEYERISAKGVHIVDGRTGAQELIPADTIIIAAGYEPDPQIVERFAGCAKVVLPIGDAVEVRNIGQAIRAGFQVAGSLVEER